MKQSKGLKNIEKAKNDGKMKKIRLDRTGQDQIGLDTIRQTDFT